MTRETPPGGGGADAVGSYRDPQRDKGSSIVPWIVGIIVALLLLLLLLWLLGVFNGDGTVDTQPVQTEPAQVEPDTAVDPVVDPAVDPAAGTGTGAP